MHWKGKKEKGIFYAGNEKLRDKGGYQATSLREERKVLFDRGIFPPRKTGKNSMTRIRWPQDAQKGRGPKKESQLSLPNAGRKRGGRDLLPYRKLPRR